MVCKLFVMVGMHSTKCACNLSAVKRNITSLFEFRIIIYKYDSIRSKLIGMVSINKIVYT